MKRGVPVPLQEFNEAVTQLQEFRRKVNKKIVSRGDAEKYIRSQPGFPGVAGDRKEPVRETTSRIVIKDSLSRSWEKLGLTPEAAKIAAQTEREEYKPSDMSLEDWASLLDKASGRRQ
jgi:hypothetical protein